MSSSAGPSKPKASPAVDFGAGVVAGAVGLVVGQPFDVVKVRYQTPQYNGRYSSITGAFRSIIREEKVPGLFKGVTSPMAGIAFINGVIFSSYSFFMRVQHPAIDGNEPSLSQICLAGAGSGLVGSLLTCPIELIKIRQQSAPPHLNPSTWSVCRDIVRANGFRGLYRGFSATAWRELAYGPYFCTYEAVCRFFKWRREPPEIRPGPHKHSSLIDEAEAELASGLSWAELMAAGGAAGVTAWVVTFPFDVCKTRMQSSVSWPENTNVGSRATEMSNMPRPAPPGLYRVAVHAVSREGWKVMFAGLWPTIVRAIPTNMIIFLTFEACVAAFS